MAMTLHALNAPNEPPHILRTTAGDFTLDEYRLGMAGRVWSILHTGAILTLADEQRFFRELRDLLPYGVALWPAAIALAHEIVTRTEGFRGKRVLELGSGTGLPGIVAASLGARVTQTDRHELAMSVCKRNGVRNDVRTVEYRLADWTTWEDTEHYDWILGSDILYRDELHPHLRRIFERNLAAGGQILLADPYRDVSIRLLETLEANNWTIALNKWQIGEEEALRSIGLFELTAPG